MKTPSAEISEKVFLKRPVLRDILNNYGKSSLKDYVQKFWQLSSSRPNEVFLDVLKNEAGKVYGKEISEAITRQIQHKPLVSTIDHHGIWGHPIFVNADLIYSLSFAADELAISLATESVSLNNTSSWSGSVLSHEGANLKRSSFFPDRLKTLPVFSAPAIGNKDIMQFKKKVGGHAEQLLDVLQLSEDRNFSEQSCKASARLWNAVFPAAPKLLYLPLETIVLKYLLEAFEDESNIFSEIILSAHGLGLWQKYFGNEHTFMFWGVDGYGRRKVLAEVPKKNELVSLMQSRQIYPSSPLCFAVLLYAGLACVGGFNQTTWLSQTKEKFLQLLTELGQTSAVERITPLPTKNFAESSLAWLNIGGSYVNPTALDLLLKGKDYYPIYKKLSENLTLCQSLELAMPDIYSVVVPKSQQNFNFSLLEAERQKLLKQQSIFSFNNDTQTVFLTF